MRIILFLVSWDKLKIILDCCCFGCRRVLDLMCFLFPFSRCDEDTISLHEDQTDCSSLRYDHHCLVLNCEGQKHLSQLSIVSSPSSSHLFSCLNSFISTLEESLSCLLLDTPLST